MTTVLLNKPVNVLSQFGSVAGHRTLKEFVDVPGIYAAGRLDRMSEGLLVLTDDGALQNQIASPEFKAPKIYWVQVEGLPGEAALQMLRSGVPLRDGMTRRAECVRMEEPAGLWARDPPVRRRKTVYDSWLCLTIYEGRNRQIRRMTAAAGYPTLRLIRYAIGDWTLDGLQPGAWRKV